MNLDKTENIIVWEKTRQLIANTYSLFEDSYDEKFKNQLQRTSDSIMNYIAEGFEKKNNFAYISSLYRAECSCIELRSILIDANEQKKIELSDYQPLITYTMDLSKMILNLINNCLTNKN